jgi:arginyl-tRNA synthetase
MIPGDIGAEIARLLRAGAAAGEWPAAAAQASASGTWRPVPAGTGANALSYATSLPLSLASLTRRPATSIAEALAGGLAILPWVGAARSTGDGYLTITVTAEHMAGLAARVAAAGRTAANSDALAGRELTARVPSDPSAAATWEQAWHARQDAVTGLLADAAGAEVSFLDSEQDLVSSSPTRAGSSPAPGPATPPSPVRDAIAFHGADAVSYALARTSAPSADSITRQLMLPLDLHNPFVLVRYAHADASSTLRWASDLGLLARSDPCRAESPAGDLLRQELALLNAMSWLPERVAAAARRHRPAEIAAYLEHVGRAWFDCRESCPPLPFQGRAAPGLADAARAAVRLCLADAARVALSSGLGLLGIGAPDRM